MIRRSLLVSTALTFAVGGCAAPTGAPPGSETELPATDPLYWPERVQPGRLEYAPDQTTFAPILTERFPYPTQQEANDAYLRLLATAPAASRPYPASLWLFGCKPGVLDSQTARVTRYRGPVVHCATDFLDAAAHRVRRETVNFYYDRSAWSMRVTDPPRSIVPWRGQEHSPKDSWWWVPGRNRYE
ncbi:hypothetical protein SAMN05519103_09020 [Rhizobiales bacterium GAS113]|nr:hypothetical protein SAMN05519103_09020 [Rhizobiales bacterium GAS113]